MIGWCAAMILATIPVVMATVRTEPLRFEHNWQPQVGISVPGKGYFEYGWKPDSNKSWDRSYTTYLLWKRPDGTRRYAINDGGDPLGRRIWIRLADGVQGLWIEEAGDSRFLAALEFDSGRFWDINLLTGYDTVQKKPSWAVASQSKLIYRAQ
jgi:hypothetical protein